MAEAAQPKERIESLDVLRGFAVLGILMVNAGLFAFPIAAVLNPGYGPYAAEGPNYWPWEVMHVFFEFKFITLFSFLFGTSLFLVGGEKGDAVRGPILRNRLFWLFVFGLIHGALIWYGDILLTYALAGAIVFFVRSWRPASLLLLGLIIFAASVFVTLFAGYLLPFAPAEIAAELDAEIFNPPLAVAESEVAAMQAGLLSALRVNFGHWLEFLQFGLAGYLVRSIGIMMIGLALFKWGVLSGRAPALLYALFVAAGVGALYLIFEESDALAAAGFPFLEVLGPGSLYNTALSPLVTLLYVSLLIFMIKAGIFGFIMGPLAAVGRIAFTNYIAQSLIMTTIFWGGRGFGLFGELDRQEVFFIVLSVWAAQLIWSPIYLRFFRIGPLEWLWRRLATGKGESFRAIAG